MISSISPITALWTPFRYSPRDTSNAVIGLLVLIDGGTGSSRVSILTRLFCLLLCSRDSSCSTTMSDFPGTKIAWDEVKLN